MADTQMRVEAAGGRDLVEVEEGRSRWDAEQDGARFRPLPPLSLRAEETSISHLFAGSAIRDRPFRGDGEQITSDTRHVLDDLTFAHAVPSELRSQSEAVLRGLLESLRSSLVPGPRLIRLRREFCQVVGKGAQCEVLAASSETEQHLSCEFHHQDGRSTATLQALKVIAIKRTKPLKADRLQDQFEFAKRDITTLCHESFRDHPNLVRLLAWGLCLDTLEDPDGDTPRIPLLILERANGNLTEYIDHRMRSQRSHDAFAGEQCKLAFDIGKGLQALHGVNMTHGDLKPDNILIFQSTLGTTAKICDFGLAVGDVDSDGTLYEYRGTPGWIPPEPPEAIQPVLLPLCDVFAYGLVVWCIAIMQSQSPIEGIRPNRLTEKDLYRRAWLDIKGCGIIRHGQDINRMHHVLQSSLFLRPLLRDREPWAYLDHRIFPLVAPSANPTRTNPALAAYELILHGTETLLPVIHALTLTLRKWQRLEERLFSSAMTCLSMPLVELFTGLCNLFLAVWSYFSPIWHSAKIPSRQRIYEMAVTRFADILQGPASAESGIDSVDPLDVSVAQHCNTEGMQLCLEGALHSEISRCRAGESTSDPQVEDNLLQLREQHMIYALARLRSRFPQASWNHRLTPSQRSNRNPGEIEAGQLSPMLGATSNILVEALMVIKDIHILAWLCRGPVGHFEISAARPQQLWCSTADSQTFAPASRLERVALLLQMGASVDDRIDDEAPMTAFGRILSALVNESNSSDTSDIQVSVCKHFRLAALKSVSKSARYFMMGELPDEESVEDAEVYMTTSLHEAVLAGSYDAVNTLVSLKFPIHVLNSHLQTAHQLAQAIWDLQISKQDRTQAQRIVEFLQRVTYNDKIDRELDLPLGWTARKLESGDLVYEEVSTGSITFLKPLFGLWDQRRLTLGFKKFSDSSQTFLIDLMRFIAATGTGSDHDYPEPSLVFDDAWFRRDVAENKARPVETPKFVKDTEIAVRETSHQVAGNQASLAILLVVLSSVAPGWGWSPGIISTLSSLAFVALDSIQTTVDLKDSPRDKRGRRMIQGAANSNTGTLICLIAIWRNNVSFAKNIVFGMLVNQMLLILGLSLMVAGIHRYESIFDPLLASTQSSLLAMGVAFLLITIAFDSTSSSTQTRAGVVSVSLGISIIQIVVLTLYFVLSIRVDRGLHPTHWVNDYEPELIDDTIPVQDHKVTVDSLKQPSKTQHNNEHTDEPSSIWPNLVSLIVLALQIPCAKNVVKYVPLVGPSTSRVYGFFIVPVCLPIVANIRIVRQAWVSGLDSSLRCAMDGPLVILYVVCPTLVFISHIRGHPMTLIFPLDEIVVLASAILIVAPIASRGKSNAMNGALLLAVCIIVYLEQFIQFT